MEQMMEVDAQAEAAGRALLRAAFEGARPGDDEALAGGAELLRRVRRRTSRRRRTMRALVPAGAVTALAGAAAAAVTLTATVASAPSAFAAVTAAAAKTSAESFRVTMDASATLPTGNGKTLSAHVTGEFDMSRGVGEESVTGRWQFQVLYAGQHTYVHTDPGSPQVVFPAGDPAEPWWELPSEAPLTSTPIAATGDQVGQPPISPDGLLGLLKSAGTVRDEGSASGPGWTGTKYGFSVTAAGSTATGYVDVDGQGQVRHLVTTLTWRTILVSPPPGPAAKPVETRGRTLTSTENVTFGDFGTPVPVTAPAASEVDQIKSPAAMSGFGW